jgi:hypothetical protein
MALASRRVRPRAEGCLRTLCHPNQTDQEPDEKYRRAAEIGVVEIHIECKAAQSGPTMRPRLMNELLSPIAAPWPMVARCEVSESTDGRRNVLDRTKKPVASKIVG